MFMRRITTISLLLIVMSAYAIQAHAAGYVVSYRIYRITADMSGNSDMKSHAGFIDNSGKLINNERHASELFDEADFKIGDMKFHLNKNGETWDGRAEPANPQQAVLISKPSLAVLAGQPAKIAISSMENMQYMKRRPDGLFELTSTTLETGMKLGVLLKPSNLGTNHILFDDLTVFSNAISGRLPIDGVQLEIGSPIIDAQRISVRIDLELGRPYGWPYIARGQGKLLIIIRVDRK